MKVACVTVPCSSVLTIDIGTASKVPMSHVNLTDNDPLSLGAGLLLVTWSTEFRAH